MVWICHIHDLDHQMDDQEHDTKRLVTRSRSSGVSIMCHMYLCPGTGTSNSTEHGRRTDAPYYQPPASGCGVYGGCLHRDHVHHLDGSTTHSHLEMR